MQKINLAFGVGFFFTIFTVGCGTGPNAGQFEINENQSQGEFSQISYENQKVSLDLSAMAAENQAIAQMNVAALNTSSAAALKSRAFFLPSGTKLTLVTEEKCNGGKNLDDADQTVIDDAEKAEADHLAIKARTIVLRRKINLEDLAKKYNSHPCVLEVSSSTQVQVIAAGLTNDPLSSVQLHLPAIQTDEGLKKLFPQLSIKQKVIIAVVDTGVDYNHEDLKTVMWKDSDGSVGYNFVKKNKNPMDDYGHGTHVAGLIGAQGNNGIGVRGILPTGAQIMAVKVLTGKGEGTYADLINGVRWAADHQAKVINLSLAGSGENASMKSALNYAVSKGATVFLAAGNAAVDLGKTFYSPASYGKDIAGAITVGSFDSVYKDRSSFSNYSASSVELSAPGSNGVRSTYPNNNYIDMQGTSMSSPVAAGAAAVAISYLGSKGKSLSPAELEKLIEASAIKSKALVPFVLNGNELNLSRLADSLLKL